MTAVLFAVGLVSILSQVVLLREIAVAFFGVELIYLIALGTWLMWTGLGALIGRRSTVPEARPVNLLLLLFAFILPADIWLIRAHRALFGAVPGAYLPFPVQLTAIVGALMPVGLVLGALFGCAARRSIGLGGTLPRAYAIESLGGVIGGLCATLLLVVGMSNLLMGLLCGLIALGAYIVSAFANAPRLRWVSLAALVPYLPALCLQGSIDQALTRLNHPHLAMSVDTPYGRITATERAGQVTIFENDALAFETGGTTAEQFAHLTAIQHPHPQRILVLGGGIEGTVGKLLQHSPLEVDYVELNRRGFKSAMAVLPEGIRRPLEGGKVTVHFLDPRRFLNATSKRYDLILVGMPEPESGQTNRFYTREFWRLCAGRLAPGGIVAFRLRAAENLWTPLLLSRTASIYRALRSVFADAVVLPGVNLLVTASDCTLVRDPGVLSARLKHRRVEARLVTPQYVNYLYTNDRFFQVAGMLNRATAPVNTDLRPICYQFTATIWLSRFYQPLTRMKLPTFGFGDLKRPSLAWVGLGLIPLLFLALRRRSGLRLVVLVGGAGLSGMVFESVMILFYQAKQGALYQDIGLLVTAFMAGLALGAWLVESRLLRSGAVSRTPYRVGTMLVAG